MKKPIFGIALFFTLGIILGRYLTPPFLPLYLALIALFSLSLIVRYLTSDFFSLKNKKVLLSSFLFASFILVGILRFHYAYFPHSSSHILTYAPSGEKVKLTGKVLTRPQLKEGTIRFVMGVEKINLEEEGKKAEGKVWVVSHFPLENYSYGDIVSVEGKLRIPREAEEKEEFDWQKYFSYQGIWVELHTGKVAVIKRGEGNFLIKWAHRSHDWMVKVIEHTLPYPYSAVLRGIMLGDKESLPLEVQKSFLRTGTGHILVVSGLHAGLILFLLLILFRALAVPYKLSFLIIIPLLGFYALLTGLRVPVSRATLMIGVGLIALLIDRDTPLLAILSLAFLIILFFNPLSLFSTSFQLSFAAVGGIIYLTPRLEEGEKLLGSFLSPLLSPLLSPIMCCLYRISYCILWVAHIISFPLMAKLKLLGKIPLFPHFQLTRKTKKAPPLQDSFSPLKASLDRKLKKISLWLRKSLAISLAAQLSILPLLAFYFNRLPLIGVFTNLIVAPLVSIILALGFLLVAFSLMSLGLAGWVAASSWLAVGLLLKITNFFSFSSSNALSRLICPYIKPFPSWVLLIYYLALVASPHFCKLIFFRLPSRPPHSSLN